jgi:hypothetical protein
MDDAQHALTEWAEGRTDGLHIDTLRALVATPQRPGRAATDRHTFWIEEYARVMKMQLRDVIPMDGGADAVQAWRHRHDDRHLQLDSLCDAHAECLVAAVPVAVRAAAKKRRTAAAAYLDTLDVAA